MRFFLVTCLKDNKEEIAFLTDDSFSKRGTDFVAQKQIFQLTDINFSRLWLFYLTHEDLNFIGLKIVIDHYYVISWSKPKWHSQRGRHR